MNLRDKILFFGIPAFAILIVIVTISESRKCNPIFDSVKKNRNFITEKYSIVEISFDKTNGPRYSNIVNKPFILSDSSQIEDLRYCLTKVESEGYMHPGRKWEILMTLKLANGEELEMIVSKVDNGGHITAHIDFYNGCPDNNVFIYSDSLLIKLNKIFNKK